MSAPPNEVNAPMLEAAGVVQRAKAAHVAAVQAYADATLSVVLADLGATNTPRWVKHAKRDTLAEVWWNETISFGYNVDGGFWWASCICDDEEYSMPGSTPRNALSALREANPDEAFAFIGAMMVEVCSV